MISLIKCKYAFRVYGGCLSRYQILFPFVWIISWPQLMWVDLFWSVYSLNGWFKLCILFSLIMIFNNELILTAMSKWCNYFLSCISFSFPQTLFSGKSCFVIPTNIRYFLNHIEQRTMALVYKAIYIPLIQISNELLIILILFVDCIFFLIGYCRFILCWWYCVVGSSIIWA
jgi:hypothetical protein